MSNLSSQNVAQQQTASKYYRAPLVSKLLVESDSPEGRENGTHQFTNAAGGEVRVHVLSLHAERYIAILEAEASSQQVQLSSEGIDAKGEIEVVALETVDQAEAEAEESADTAPDDDDDDPVDGGDLTRAPAQISSDGEISVLVGDGTVWKSDKTDIEKVIKEHSEQMDKRIAVFSRDTETDEIDAEIEDRVIFCNGKLLAILVVRRAEVHAVRCDSRDYPPPHA